MSFYVCSDLHGQGNLWDKIKEFLEPTDTLFCLGDCIDRGLDGWRILKEMLLDERVYLLKGNHEDMMVNFFINKNQYNHSLWMYNGGEPTLKDFNKEEDKEEWIKKINDLPQYINIVINGKEFKMSHAGYTPNLNPEELIKYGDLLWDRNHFEEEWPNEEKYKNVYILHGHTPIPNLIKCNPYDFPIGVYWYNNGHKADLDQLSIISHKTVLLNLETLKEYIIDEEDE